jgi:mono/diheme cytochrome c family protein
MGMRLVGVVAFLSLTNVAFATSPGTASPPTRKGTNVLQSVRVTAVEGESWLRHLGMPFIASNMGRVASWGPSPTIAPGQPTLRRGSDGDFVLSGADLYRLSCRSCHGADGEGVPPSINSVIGPVQATSAVMIRAQMKRRGVDLDAKTLNQLVSQSQALLRTRLLNGGERMPPFRHLTAGEVESLLAYLEALAGVPGAEGRQILLSEPAARVGEHLVRGTCHICHESNGPGLAAAVGGHEEIPSLASIVKDRSSSEVIRKVREGLARPTPMMTSNRGDMPIFHSLTPEEIAAAYDYLVRYPPLP